MTRKGHSPRAFSLRILYGELALLQFFRLTGDCGFRQGAEPGAVMLKELALSGVQRPLYKGELRSDAVEVLRFGDFAGWLIEA